MGKTKKTLEELDIMDDFLFTELMLHPTSAELLVRLIIERAIGMEVGELIIEPQRVINGIDTNRHGIRMDVRVINPEILIKEEGKQVLRIFDIEPNNTPNDNLPKRDRYYQALNDSKLLDANVGYDNLPELWSIWILPYDPFHANHMIYFVKNKVEGLPEIMYNDGVTKVFMYTHGTLEGNESLKNLLKYISSTTEQNANDTALKQLHNEVQSIKHQKDIGVKYMRMVDYIEEECKAARKEARAEGLAEGRAEGIAQDSTEKLLKVLSRKGTVSEELKQKIASETDISVLNAWFDAALDVDSIDTFIQMM